MLFNNNHLVTQTIHLINPIYLLIVDLKKHKDTKKILADLNHCFPFAKK